MFKVKRSEEYKQAILIRADLKMSPGKIAAQASHASVEASLRVMKQDDILKSKIFQQWRREGMKKVILKVSTERDLFKYKDEAERVGLKVYAVKDAGHTEVEPGTFTAIAIGPAKGEKIDRVTGGLPTL